MDISYPRIGYAPYDQSLTHPGDRRRFVAYANARKLPFELARPDEHYDVVVLTELADISVWSKYQHGKVIYDLIDSYLAVPRTNPKQLLRGLVWFANGRHHRPLLDFKGAIQNMCRRADAVVCATEEQKSDIQVFGQNVHIILDIHDLVVRNIKHDYSCGAPFNLVWEGLPSNLPQLATIGPVLHEISRRRPIILNIVTDHDRPGALPYLNRINSANVAKKIFEKFVFHRWNETTCSRIITGCDVAIIPLDLDDPLTRLKSANKLALLWRMAMPVITSATSAYLNMQNTAGLGYLACNDRADWLIALDRLMGNENERRMAGECGLGFATSNLQTKNVVKLWDDVFSSIGYDVSKFGT